MTKPPNGDDEGAVGKGAAEPLGGPQRNQITRTGASCTGEANPEESFHAVSPFPGAAAMYSTLPRLPVGVIGRQ